MVDDDDGGVVMGSLEEVGEISHCLIQSIEETHDENILSIESIAMTIGESGIAIGRHKERLGKLSRNWAETQPRWIYTLSPDPVRNQH